MMKSQHVKVSMLCTTFRAFQDTHVSPDSVLGAPNLVKLSPWVGTIRGHRSPFQLARNNRKAGASSAGRTDR